MKVFPGIYREQASIHGVGSSGILLNGTAFTGHKLSIVGDESWTPSAIGNPNVRVTGADVDNPTPTKVRFAGMTCQNCTAVEIRGFLFDYAANTGLLCMNGAYRVLNCKGANNTFAGLEFLNGVFGEFNGCSATGNTHGILVSSSGGSVHNSKCESNSNSGLYVSYSVVYVYNSHFNSNQAGAGVYIRQHAEVEFSPSSTSYIQNNTCPGIYVIMDSFVRGSVFVVYSNNSGGNIQTLLGGNIY